MKSEDEKKEIIKQARLVEKLAKRLPWIVLALSLIGFIATFIEAILSK